MEIPKNLYYTKDHKWVRKENEEFITVGVTDPGQDKLGEVKNVDLNGDENLGQGDKYGIIKGANKEDDLNAPLATYVDTPNTDILNDCPDLINEDPYGDGWIFRGKDYDEKQLKDLMDADEYEKFLNEEEEESFE